MPGDEYLMDSEEGLTDENENVVGQIEERIEGLVNKLGTLEDKNEKTANGLKKPHLFLNPPTALLVMSEAFKDGISPDKYSPYNWRDDGASVSIFLSACQRHIMSWMDGEENAKDSKVHHLGHAMACLAIIIDAQYCGKLIDDRPPKADTAGLIDLLTVTTKGK